MKTENEISMLYSVTVLVVPLIFCFGNTTVYFIASIVCCLILSQPVIQHKLHKDVRAHMLKQIQALDSEISDEEAAIAAAKQESVKKAKGYVRRHLPINLHHLRAVVLPKEYKLAYYSGDVVPCKDNIMEIDW